MAVKNSECDEAHKAELQKERDEISRLKAELKEAQSQNVELEKAAAVDKKRQETEAQKHKELLDQTQARATSVQKELDELKAKARNWTLKLEKINSEMAS